jgi:hypothetical protein
MVVLLFDGPLTFREFMTHEELPLATVFREVLTWLGGRGDIVLFGAQAINAWVDAPRMTEDVDLLSTDAERVAEEVRAHLARKFHIATRVREVVPGGFRVYQVRKPKNRHLVDVRQVAALPEHRVLDGVAVATPVELAAMKVTSMASRRGKPKGDTDRADLRRLLITFSDLRTVDGPVAERLRAQGASDEVLALWRDTAREPVAPDDEDDL